MRRRRIARGAVGGAVAALAATASAVAAGASASVPSATAAKAPARMLVYAQEWSLWPSRTSVTAGKVVVQLWNRGQDAHDLRIRRLRHGRMSGRPQVVTKTASGGLRTATWHLGPGRYEIYCSLPGHLAKGMHTTLVVR